MLGQSVLVSVLGGLLSLDRTGAFQFMVSRPIVTAPLTGLALGRPFEGLVTGVLLELLLIGDLPVGAYVPLHETGLSVLTTVVVASASTAQTGLVELLPAVVVALVFAVPVTGVYRAADAFARRYNARFYFAALGSLERGEEVSLARENLKGLLVFFLTGTAALLATVVPAAFASRAFFSALPVRHMEPVIIGAVALGVAAGYSALHTGRSLYIFSGVLLLGILALSL